MPNHFHGIIIVGAALCGRPEQEKGRTNKEKRQPHNNNGQPHRCPLMGAPTDANAKQRGREEPRGPVNHQEMIKNFIDIFFG
jgi:hypothetical protein